MPPLVTLLLSLFLDVVPLTLFYPDLQFVEHYYYCEFQCLGGRPPEAILAPRVARHRARWERMARDNHHMAQYLMGVCARAGLGQPPDLQAAYQWFSRAAEKNNPLALMEKGWADLDGRGVVANPTEAYKAFITAAAEGWPDAFVWRSVCEARGIGTEVDHVAAVGCAIHAAAHRRWDALAVLVDPRLQVWFPRLPPATSKKCLNDLVRWRVSFASTGSSRAFIAQEGEKQGPTWEREAQLGCPVAQFLWAVKQEQENTQGVLTAIAAVEWYRRAASQGLPEAQRALALCLDEGYGCDADPIEATEWFQASAHAGNTDAAYHLGHRYEKAHGVLRNRERAVEWYRFAAERGHGPAMLALAECYASGVGVPKNRLLAWLWLVRAAIQRPEALSDDARASFGQRTLEIFVLRHLVATSSEMRRRERETVQLRQLLPKKGLPEAMSSRVFEYSGEFVFHFQASSDEPIHVSIRFGLKADRIRLSERYVAWANQAINEGDPRAALILSDVALHGRGQPADTKEGLRLLRLAALEDCPQAWALYRLRHPEVEAHESNTIVRLYLLEYRAAQRGEPLGLFQHGTSLVQLQPPLPHDPVAGVRWLRVAAQKRYLPAMLMMAFCAWNGEGMKAEPLTALGWGLRTVDELIKHGRFRDAEINGSVKIEVPKSSP